MPTVNGHKLKCILARGICTKFSTLRLIPSMCVLLVFPIWRNVDVVRHKHGSSVATVYMDCRNLHTALK